MSRYKVLQVEFWMNPKSVGFANTIKFYREIQPIMHRNGQYLDRISDIWWFEYDGRAWTDDEHGKKMFKFTLHAMMSQFLSKVEITNLVMVRNKTTSKALKRQISTMIYDSDMHRLVCYGGDVDGRIRTLRAKKRYRKFMEEFKNGSAKTEAGSP